MPTPPRLDRLEVTVEAIHNRISSDAVQRSRRLGRASVVRIRMAFGNTSHLKDQSRGR